MASKVYGFRLSHTEDDQLYLWQMFRSAMDRRAPVRITYFETKKYESGPDKGKPVLTESGSLMYARISRVVEPYELDVTEDGHRIVRVVDRTPKGVGSRPEYRTYRLDRFAVRFADGRPLVTRMLTHGYLCPSRLDGVSLHPRKLPPKDLPPGDVPDWYVAA